MIDFAQAEFPKEFGGRGLWLAPQNAWNLKGDNTCAWGGALAYQNPGIGELGPGYDHSAVPGRSPLLREREGGKFYEDSWLKFLRRPSHFVMIETWNEFHEGTDIAESQEYGRQYIELTRKYSDLFKQGWKPPPLKGLFTGATSVMIAPGKSESPAGLQLVTAEDGQNAVETVAGRAAWKPVRFRSGEVLYLYFRAEDSFKWADTLQVAVAVDYFDGAAGELAIEYDGRDASAPGKGAYSRSQKVRLAGDRQWKTATFELRDARLIGSQNAGADFRIVAETREFAVSRIVLRRR